MSKDTIVLDKDKANELYKKVVESLPNKKDFDELVDSRLIMELFSREVVNYLSRMHVIEANDFKRVDCFVNGKLVKVSFGMIKPHETAEARLTYGII